MPDQSSFGAGPTAAATLNDWTSRFDELSHEAAVSGLSPQGLDDLGLAAWFIGRGDESERAWDAAHRAFLEAGDVDAAVRCVFWIGFTLSEEGDDIRAGAWMARLFELCQSERAGRRSEGMVAICRSVAAYARGEGDESAVLAAQAVALARGAHDADVEVLATMALGRALVGTGRIEDGFAQMDQVMLMISSHRVGDRVAGPAYCAVIASCLARWDLERARVWTRDLSSWCDTQQGLAPFRGECSVLRAVVLRVGGEWGEAERTLSEVAERERRPETKENALYGLAELHRLAGRRREAEAAFRLAADLGREVQPGFALLRRDEGDSAAARSGVARALDAAVEPSRRADLLAAQVELEVADGDLGTAERAGAELEALADALGTVYLHGQADRARGIVLIASGGAAAALPLLRRSWSAWRRLDAPYEAALTRVQLGRAARALGDEEGAQLEFDAARSALTTLGAAPDLARLERIASPQTPSPAGGLTPREVEVLALVARGLPNRGIAHELFLSERTVARHVSNILAKLSLPNRAAATAFAFEHGMTTPA
ncbi:LuxR C-terminal-related transcriptional regulator [Microbacterium deminutum]|uniref:HTH luxR-type domain-containing protein n=1 Tax=Microbacterium deminutum TaxID=344164 RepID=A0ABN2QRA4_9MICO